MRKEADLVQWFRITVETTTAAVAAVSEILTAAGANGVQVADAADPEHIQARTADEVFDWRSIPHRQAGAAVTAYYPVDDQDAARLAQIQSRVAALPQAGFTAAAAGPVHTKIIADEDWSTNWRQYYRPVRISRFLTVVPAWSDYQPANDQEQIIRMDPGEAFGTGTHPTTQLSLALLEMIMRGGESLIDVGTGAGILSIAATLFGAAGILATEIDDQALNVARRNIKLNPQARNIRLEPANLLADVTERADIIMANILAEVLLPLIPQLPDHLRPQGTVILSGIYRDKTAAITAALAQHGLVPIYTLTNGEWAAIAAKRQTEVG